MAMVVFWARAPGGMTSVTFPFSPVTVPPALPMEVPSFTAMSAVPLLPSMVAVMVATPVATAVTSPVVETLATDPSLVLQVTLRPERALPEESFGVAGSWAGPGGIKVAVRGPTPAQAPGGGGVGPPPPPPPRGTDRRGRRRG